MIIENNDISLVIPVLNAAEYIIDLIENILSQKPHVPGEIILVDSESKDDTVELASRYRQVKIIEIKNFTHGRSRNLGAKYANGKIVVFMTQDALPKDEYWLYNLIKYFDDEEVAASYSRQVPRDDAVFTERFFLETRFPDTKPAKRKLKKEGDVLSLEKVFFSNVSSAVRRSVLLEYPFDENLIMSEDQQLSRDLLDAGFAIIYASDSIVIHSHDYTLKDVFKRYFDSVFSLTQIFPTHNMGTSIAMGVEYLRKEVVYVIKNYPNKICYYFFYTAAKTTGTLMGHFAKIIPRFILRRISFHNYHWK